MLRTVRPYLLLASETLNQGICGFSVLLLFSICLTILLMWYLTVHVRFVEICIGKLQIEVLTAFVYKYCAFSKS